MKKFFLPLLAIGLMLFGCGPKQDSIVGDWTVDKVNVQFDERQSTPELVRQTGEMEKHNTFNISSDSILRFKGLYEQWEGIITLTDGGNICCDGQPFGHWTEGQITTRTDSPLGEITVIYKKK